MIRFKQRIFVGMVLLVLLSACGEGPTSPTLQGAAVSNESLSPADIADLEHRTMVNAAVVQIAVEDWADDMLGFYPRFLSHRNNRGLTVVDYLPSGVLMENPFTQANTEPVNGPATAPGQIGYRAIASFLFTEGYTITGHGYDGELFVWSVDPDADPLERDPISLVPAPMDPDLTTLRQAVAVRTALDAWTADNAGVYPSGPESPNLVGKTVLDYLPGGSRVRNPFTGSRTSPQNGLAAAPGDVSFQPVVQNSVLVGYSLSAQGSYGLIWRWDPMDME